MPLYTFKHPKKNKFVDVLLSMNDDKKYIDDSGVEWERQWSIPNASIDTKIDPFSKKDFVNKTATKKGETMGDIYDRSREMSEAREAKEGFDSIKKEYNESYKKKTGKRRLSEIKENFNKTIVI